MQRLVQSFVRYNFFVIATPTATTTFPKNLIAIVVTTFLKNIIATLLANFFNPFSRFKRKKTLWILLENQQKFPPNVIHWQEKNCQVVLIATMVATCNELLHVMNCYITRQTRFKLSTYLNDWMLKNLCIFSCTPGTTWWKISTTSEWHISLICYYQCLAW